MRTEDEQQFEEFVVKMEPKLRRALVGHLHPAAVPDALAEAFTHAWVHWPRVRSMLHPGGYLFRVCQSKSRRRMEGALADPNGRVDIQFEPGLAPAMRALPPQQRSAVWLVHACGWTYADAAEALGISASAVGTHVSRGMTALRAQLKVAIDD